MKKHHVVASLLFAMRITFVQLASIITFTSAVFANKIEAQVISEKKFSLTVNNAEINKVIEIIQKDTKINFLYSANKIKADRLLSFSANNKKLIDFLEETLKPLGIGYKLEENQILLYPLREETSKLISNKAEYFGNYISLLTVTGIVTNENGEFLPGANINLKNSSRYAVTDQKGEFTIEVDDENSELVITFTGYASKEVRVGKNKILNIILSSKDKALEDVVVIGYGKVRRADLTGSVSKVNEQAIRSTPIVAIDRALQGRVSGVQVTTNSARPGGATTIRIRGTGSVNAGNEPLYVIDGYPTGDLNSINPNDIESIDILKDASATAIYGSRGSNGVVIVTTKRGKTNQSLIDFSTYYGIQSVRKKTAAPERKGICRVSQ